jgi:AcrR family transcriptional regulator
MDTNTNFKPVRKYNAHVQSEVKTLTRQRILDAARDLFLEKWIDELTLQDVAGYAGVTVQTVIRHFGTREQLLRTAVEEIDLGARDHRRLQTDGSLSGIVAALVDYYETYHAWVLRSLAQESRIPELSISLTKGRQQHCDWLLTCFALYLNALSEPQRKALADQLYTLCEIYVWRVYRLDLNQPRSVLEIAWHSLLRAVIQSYSLVPVE